jgi:hypothetical protein
MSPFVREEYAEVLEDYSGRKDVRVALFPRLYRKGPTHNRDARESSLTRLQVVADHVLRLVQRGQPCPGATVLLKRAVAVFGDGAKSQEANSSLTIGAFQEL